MFDVPGSNVTGVYICEGVVAGTKKAEYITGPIETSESNPDFDDRRELNVTSTGF